MRAIGRVLLGLATGVLAVVPSAGAPGDRGRVVVTHDLQVAAFSSEEESARAVRIAFDPDGGLVVVFVVEDRRDDVALVWRRVGPAGAVSPPTRIPLPDLAQRIAHLSTVVVDSTGTTSIALRLAYRPSWDEYGPFLDAPTRILRVTGDGAVAGDLDLGVAAERALLAAHGGLVDVAYDADPGDLGDRAVYWRQIGADGAFNGDPVRLSEPIADGAANGFIGIWDVFLGVAGDGVARVLYRRIEAERIGYDYEITSGPEVFWHSVSRSGGASAPVSLGSVPSGNYSWRVAFAPDGGVCLMSYIDYGSAAYDSSFPRPLVVSPEGEVREVRGKVLPRIHTNYPGEQYGLAADGDSRFHLAVFATSAWRKKGGHVAPSLFLGSLSPGGEAGRIRRIRIGRRPEYVWSHEVAEDGTTAIGGTRYVRLYHPNESKRREDVTVVFADRAGRRLRRVTFRNPPMTNTKQPVLASTSAGGRTRFAAAWSGWRSPDRPDNRYVRVVLFERRTGR